MVYGEPFRMTRLPDDWLSPILALPLPVWIS
jgi:hypothetical protein